MSQTPEQRELEYLTTQLAQLDTDETDAETLKDATTLAGKLLFHERKARILRQRLNLRQRKDAIDTPATFVKALQDKLDAAGITIDGDKSQYDATTLNAIVDSAMPLAEKKAIVAAGYATRSNKKLLGF